MHGQLTPARYSNMIIREHLVSQYLLGTLSLRTKRRLESLMANDDSWYELVTQWHSRLSGLEPMTSDKPPSWVWKNIKNVLDKPEKLSFWQRFWSINVWQRKWLTLSLACTALLFVFSSTMLFITDPKIAPPSYIAVMSSAEKNDLFVLMAYKGDKPGGSSLRLEWNSRLQQKDNEQETPMLWARNKDTGQVALLARFSDLKTPQLLTPTEWNMIKQSSELFITANNNPESKVLFRGRCIELSLPSV